MRTPSSPLFTPTEAAVLTRLSLRFVNTTIDKRMIPMTEGQWAGHTTRLLELRALISIMLQHRFADCFRFDLRRKLLDALGISTRNKILLEWSLFTITIDLREPRRELAASLRALRRIHDLVSSDPDIMDGEFIFRDTRVPVHLIAMLLGKGLSAADLLEGYPHLTAEMVQLTPVYAAAYPLRGRPRLQLWCEQAPTQALAKSCSGFSAISSCVRQLCESIKPV